MEGNFCPKLSLWAVVYVRQVLPSSFSRNVGLFLPDVFRNQMWKAESVSEYLMVNQVHIFAFFILNIIPEAELCKHIRESACHLTETMLLKDRM